MIYVFGQGKNCSIIYDGSTLSDIQKQNALVVESLPPRFSKKGFRDILVKENGTLRWEYEEVVEVIETIEETIQE
jgi:hypothetical protein